MGINVGSISRRTGFVTAKARSCILPLESKSGVAVAVRGIRYLPAVDVS